LKGLVHEGSVPELRAVPFAGETKALSRDHDQVLGDEFVEGPVHVLLGHAQSRGE